MGINLTLLTLLFFPEYPNGIPGDMYLVHLFFFLIVIPFGLIVLAARSHDRDNPNAAASGYKDSKAGAFIGFEFRK